MPKYLIDVNLPSRFSLWSSDDHTHVVNINDELSDSEIWQLAKDKNLTIVTKDADFSELALLNNPPPRVIHIKVGNMKINQFHKFINEVWVDVCQLSDDCKLVQVFNDKIEGID